MKNELKEQVFTALIDSAANETFMEELCASEVADEFVFSNEFDIRIKPLINAAKRRESLGFVKQMGKYVAVILIAFMVVFGIGLASVDAFRVSVLNFLETSDGRYIKVGYITGEQQASTGTIQGFVVEKQVQHDDGWTIYYKNEKGEILYHQVATKIMGMFAQVPGDAGRTYEKEFDGIKILFAEDGELTTLVWEHNDQLHTIYAYLSSDEMWNIAKQLIKNNK